MNAQTRGTFDLHLQSAFARDPTIDTRHSPGRPLRTCSTIACTSVLIVANRRFSALCSKKARGLRKVSQTNPGCQVWAVWLAADRVAVAERGLAGGKGSGVADLATRSAEGAAETTATRAVVVADGSCILPRVFHRLHPGSGCGSRAGASARDFDPNHRTHSQAAQDRLLALARLIAPER